MLDLTVLYSHPTKGSRETTSWIKILAPGIFHAIPPPHRNRNMKKIEEVRQEQHCYLCIRQVLAHLGATLWTSTFLESSHCQSRIFGENRGCILKSSDLHTEPLIIGNLLSTTNQTQLTQLRAQKLNLGYNYRRLRAERLFPSRFLTK